ncbi:MAG: toprim domain-containing protein [Ruminiclostridium sp.]|nr:toprim domain-containing protein [Ruminiclostridium sp.]
MAEFIPFTDDDKLRASSVDLVSFLQSRGEQLKRLGHDYKLIYTDGGGVHDSIMIRGNHWYDHKNQVGGGPIKFMREYYGMTYQDAMLSLLGGYNNRASPDKAPIKLSSKIEYERKPFKLPEPNDNMRRAFAYLTKQRFIAPDVISFFAHKGTIYEDKTHHNVVFVGMDEDGVPKQAHARSTLSFGSTFRITVEGSDTKYSFAHFGWNDTLYVFEAPIDLLSYITLHPQNWQDSSYIAMNGVYESAVLNALETRPQLDNIVLCTDNDEGGIEAVERISDILAENGFTSIYRDCPQYKDWNEDLKAMNGIEPLPAVPHKRIELYGMTVGEARFRPHDMYKTADILQTAIHSGDYRYAAEIALSASALLSKVFAEPHDAEKLFVLLQRKAVNGYKAYTDKGRMNSKLDDLRNAIREVSAELRRNSACTIDEMRELAKKLYNAADLAFRCRTEQLVQETQNNNLTETEEEQPWMEISM